MKKRPASITVISWILIVMGGISLTVTPAMFNNPMVRESMGRSPVSVPVQLAMIYAALVVDAVSGIFMLRGKASARILYVAWSFVSLVFGLATSPAKLALVPGFVVFAVVSFFLFRPRANEFFSAAAPPDGIPRV